MQKKLTLHYAGFQPNVSGFGWATCNANLRRELGKHFQLVESQTADICFIPLADHDFNPVSPARGKINLAYTFFEFPLGQNAKANADSYDVVFAGSTWCIDRLREKGITNTRLLIQGVDRDIFYPSPGRKPDGQFRIFSGGKFEYRKGQDLVIAAFKEFSKAHPEAHLICSWFNPWPQLIGGMRQSPHVAIYENESPTQQMFFADMLCYNGLRRNQFTVLPKLSQQDLAGEMRNTDCGLFPNRCEGGTNLVLMEYAACGRPIMANTYTGHSDVKQAVTWEIPACPDSNNWAIQRVADIIDAVEQAYHQHSRLGVQRSIEWTWASAADTIVAALTELQQNGKVAA